MEIRSSSYPPVLMKSQVKFRSPQNISGASAVFVTVFFGSENWSEQRLMGKLFLGQGFKGHQLHDVLSSPGSADLTADVDFSYLRRMAGGDVACLGPVTQGTFLKNMGIDSRMQVRLTVWQVLQSKLSITGSIRVPKSNVIYFQCVEMGVRVSKGRVLTHLVLPQVLLRNCSDPSTRKQLISSYDMLTNPSKMGERFHFFSLLHRSRLAKPKKLEGLTLEKRSPAPLPVAGFTKLKFSWWAETNSEPHLAFR